VSKHTKDSVRKLNELHTVIPESKKRYKVKEDELNKSDLKITEIKEEKTEIEDTFKKEEIEDGNRNQIRDASTDTESTNTRTENTVINKDNTERSNVSKLSKKGRMRGSQGYKSTPESGDKSY